MLKTSLALCAIAVYTGCPGGKQRIKVADSPIIVSDGTTHLKHKGAAKDFDSVVQNSNTIDVTVSSFKVDKLECSIGFSGCKVANPIPLTSPWTLDVFHGTDHLGYKILTIKSMDNQSVTGTIYARSYTQQNDAANDEAKGGTDLVEADHIPQSAALTMSGQTTYFTCPQKPCSLKILHPPPPPAR
jgi:hypothetical protein